MSANSDFSQPLIHTKFGPTPLIPRGYIWMVTFELPKPASKNGWIIQEVYSTLTRRGIGKNLNKNFHFWEAWKILRGQSRSSTTLLVFQQLLSMGFTPSEVSDIQKVFPAANSSVHDCFAKVVAEANTTGEVTVLASARYYPVDLPTDFIQNNHETEAKSLYSTIKKPEFWEGPGSYRALFYSWNFTGGQTKADIRTARRDNHAVFQGAN